MSYLTQMAGLAWHNFTSAAAGIGVALALARGLTRRRGPEGAEDARQLLGRPDPRASLYVLLPICIVGALVLVSQGVIQNFAPYREVTTLEGAKQMIAMGPVASQEAIKMLGTNGGGFFNANSAHPFENPTPLTNFVADAARSSPSRRRSPTPTAAWRATSGRAGRSSPPWRVLFLVGRRRVAYWAEAARQPGARSGLAVDQAAGNMEGKEVRFGVADSALFATVTTDASCGAVNSMHDSFTPLGGLVPLVNIQLGEVDLRRRRRGPLRHARLRRCSRSSSPASWSGARPSTWARRSRRAR